MHEVAEVFARSAGHGLSDSLRVFGVRLNSNKVILGDVEPPILQVLDGLLVAEESRPAHHIYCLQVPFLLLSLVVIEEGQVEHRVRVPLVQLEGTFVEVNSLGRTVTLKDQRGAIAGLRVTFLAGS